MRVVRNLTFLLLLSAGLSSCGEKAGPNISVVFSGTNAFADSNVTDIVFLAENVESNGLILDQDGDQLPDLYVFPSGCGLAMPAACGFPVSQAGSVVEIGDLPLNYLYRVDVRFRDASGTTLYSGSSSLVNDGVNLTVTVSLSAGDL